MFSLAGSLAHGPILRARTWLHVQDFEADAGFELGLLHSPGLRSAIERAKKSLCPPLTGFPPFPRRCWPGWYEKEWRPPPAVCSPTGLIRMRSIPCGSRSPLRAELGISRKETVALYSGTMARKQGLEIMAEAARRLCGTSGLRFVFCGEGPGKAEPWLSLTAPSPQRSMDSAPAFRTAQRFAQSGRYSFTAAESRCRRSRHALEANRHAGQRTAGGGHGSREYAAGGGGRGPRNCSRARRCCRVCRCGGATCRMTRIGAKDWEESPRICAC